MLKSKLIDIKYHLFEWCGLTLYGDLYPLLSMNDTQAPKVFVRLINDALNYYDQYYPVYRSFNLNGAKSRKSIKIESNFDQYLKGSIPEESIILDPVHVYYVKGWLALNGQWWNWNPFEKTITMNFSTTVSKVEYFANHPLVVNFGPDGDVTDDSYIYFIDMWNDEVLRVFIQYYILRYLRNVNTSIELPNNVQFLKNLDTMIGELNERMNEYIETRVHVMRMWRK